VLVLTVAGLGTEYWRGLCAGLVSNGYGFQHTLAVSMVLQLWVAVEEIFVGFSMVLTTYVERTFLW
jgi:hypothetical protein